MSEPQSQQERRSEVRRRVPAKRISWTRESGTEVCSGWMSDVASSSVAFVAPTRNLPALGEAIELTFDAQGSHARHRSARVVRTARQDRFFSVVACRTQTPSEPCNISGDDLVGLHPGW